MNSKNLEIAIYVTAVLLAVGVFLPLTSLPVYGDVSYNHIASVESYLVIVLALSAPALVLAGQSKWVKFSPVGVWLVLLYPAIEGLFKSEDTSLLGKMSNKAASVMQDFAADLFLNIDLFSWGGYVFLLGLLGFTVACVMRSLK